MSKKNNTNNIENKIQKLRTVVATGLTTVGSSLLLNSAQAQETQTQDAVTNNIEQTAHTFQRTDYLNSNAEKLFDMYRLAFNNDTRFNMVAEKEKTKTKIDFFNFENLNFDDKNKSFFKNWIVYDDPKESRFTKLFKE